ITGGITGASAGSGSTINQTLTNPSNATAGTVQYLVTPTATTGLCAGAAFTITVTVNPTPVLTSTLTPLAICSTTTFSYSATSSTTGSTFSWTRAAVPGISNTAESGTNGTISEVLTNTTSNPIVVTYIVTTTANSCSNSQNVTVTVNALPTVTTAATATAVCFSANVQSTTLTYNATSSTPTSYSIVWNSSPTNSFTAVTDAIFPESPISINIPAGTAAGTYTGTITVKNANGCVSTGTTFTVTVNSCLVSLVKQSELFNTGNCTSVGDKIKYTFTLTNLGTTPITNITITDPLFNAPNPIVPTIFVSGDTNSNLSLDTNETWVYIANYSITQKDIDTGKVTNQATVNGLVLGSDAVNDLSGTNSTNNNPTITQLCQNPKIAIVKTNDITVGENGCATIKVGDKVNYTFTVTNTGNVSLHNVAVSDPHQGLSAIVLQSGDTNTNSILDVTETWVYKANYTVTQADIDAGNITNQASVSGFAPNETKVIDLSGGSSITNEPNVIPICSDSGIAIVKTNDITVGENGCATIKVGDKVNYTFTVTNTGNVSLHNVAVSDPHAGLSAIALQSGDTNTNSILDVTETWVYKADYTVNQADIDAGNITNQASVSGFAPNETKVIDLSGGSSTTNEPNVIPICTNPGIAIVKTNDITVGENGCASIKVGDKVNYTFIVTNTGNVSLHNVAVSDPHAGLSAIALQSGDTNTNSILDVTETWIYKANYTVTQADIDAGNITNQASVSGFAPNETKVIDLSGGSSTTNEPNVIPICTNPGIAIVKTNDITVGENGCATIKVGDKVNYTFTVTNTGNVSLHNVTVADPHTGLSAIALQSGDTNTDNILDVSETWIYKADYTVTQADIDAGNITNQASVSGFAPNETKVIDLSGNSSTTNGSNVIPICNNPSISITKDGTYVDTNQDGKTNVGDMVSYNFVIKNTGNVTLTNITVTDNNAIISGGSIAILAVGATDTTTFSASHAITQDDINKGFVYNLALATAKDPKNQTITDTSSDPTPCTSCPIKEDCPDCTITVLNQSPGISITKDGTYVDTNHDGITNVGDMVSYNFVVKNTGNVTLTNVTVTDNNAIVSGGSIASLAVGATDATTFTASHTITQDDINKGFVYNLALATAKDPKNQNVTDTSSDPTPCTSCPIKEDCPDCTITVLNQTPGILITKDGTYVDTNQDGKTNVGDMVSYNFVIKNTGNVTLTNVTVTDNNAIVSGGPIATLAPGATDATTFTASHAITQDDINKGIVYNLALATAKDPKNQNVTDTSSDPTPCTSCPIKEDCPDCTITVLNQTPGILITKDGTYVDTNQDGKTSVGDMVSYNFVVKNTGNVTLTNVTVTDNNAIVSGGPIAILTVGATDTTTFTASHTITQDDINKGFVYNLALATAKDPKNQNVTDTSSDPTPCTSCPKDPECADCTITVLPQSPGLNIDKTAIVISRGTESEVYSFVGDVINYTISVTNTGNVTLHNIVVKDPLTGLDTTNEPFNLAPGEHKEFQQSHTITVNDLKGNSITNVATANGLTPNNTPITTEDTVIVEKAQVLGCGTIFVHNAFTPNGDEFNDKFKIDNIEDTLCYPENSVEIYNRWGILVFETKGYDNGNNVFKGYSEGRVTVDKNAGLPTGTYFYILKYTAVGLQGETIAKQEQGYLYLSR
ncbi:DUF7507 domain-containing protein, partial [Flavobacterium undicola]|uniref:DUF7507 domain-containing protein n=1 Tax=Flavobacterium undicola TaxID=1932779 RepID=UPI0015E1E0BD